MSIVELKPNPIELWAWREMEVYVKRPERMAVDAITEVGIVLAVENSPVDLKEVPVKAQVLHTILNCRTTEVIAKEYGIQPSEQMVRVLEIAQEVTRNMKENLETAFWRGLEIGYISSMWMPIGGYTTEELAKENNVFVAMNAGEFSRGEENGYAHFMGYIIGAEIAGIRLTTDAIIDFAIRKGMLPCDVEKAVNPGGILEEIDRKLSGEIGAYNRKRGISLQPARRNIKPTINLSISGQLEIMRGSKKPYKKELTDGEQNGR